MTDMPAYRDAYASLERDDSPEARAALIAAVDAHDAVLDPHPDGPNPWPAFAGDTSGAGSSSE